MPVPPHTIDPRDVAAAAPREASSLASRPGGDHAAVVRRFAALVYAVAQRAVGDAHAAEDVSQAVFIVYLRKADRLNPSLLPGWFVTTTRLAARDAARKHLARRRHETAASALTTAAPPARDTPVDVERFDAALARLRPRERTAVVLRFYDGLSWSEVAAATGTTEAAAGKRVARAVERLRGLLGGHGGLAAGGLAADGLAGMLSVARTPLPPAGLLPSLDHPTPSTPSALARAVEAAMSWRRLGPLLAGAAVAVIVGGVALVVLTPPARVPVPPVATAVPAPATAPATMPGDGWAWRRERVMQPGPVMFTAAHPDRLESVTLEVRADGLDTPERYDALAKQMRAGLPQYLAFTGLTADGPLEVRRDSGGRRERWTIRGHGPDGAAGVIAVVLVLGKPGLVFSTVARTDADAADLLRMADAVGP